MGMTRRRKTADREKRGLRGNEGDPALGIRHQHMDMTRGGLPVRAIRRAHPGSCETLFGQQPACPAHWHIPGEAWAILFAPACAATL